MLEARDTMEDAEDANQRSMGRRRIWLDFDRIMDV